MLDGETQVSTVWLQCVLLFSMIWGMCSTLTSDSRKAFDVYLRKLSLGNVEEYPKPKAFKLTKQQLFPDKGTVYDWIYDKRNNGSWIPWMDTTLQVLNILISIISILLCFLQYYVTFVKCLKHNTDRLFVFCND